ncbi:hypothetical protein JCM5350_000483 [Sporobolomyces pararoseus]
MERAIAVILPSQVQGQYLDMEESLKREGFDVVVTASVSRERLSEAGLDCGFSEGRESAEIRASYKVLLIEKGNASRSLADFESRRANLDPAILTTSTPSVIKALFPSLATSPSLETQSSSSLSDAFSDKTPTKHFPLSNLALNAKIAPSPTLTRNLSPKIAQALEQLENPHASPSSQIDNRERRVFTESSKERKDQVEEDGLQDQQVEGDSRQAEHPSTIDEACSVSSKEILQDDTARPTSSTSLSVSATSATSSTSFKARPAPLPPTAQPRMTKAAALRLGVAVVPPTPRASTKRQSISTSERAALDRLTRRQSVQLPSTTPVPTKPVEVRMSKAAMLRMGIPIPVPEASTRSRQSTANSLAESDISSKSTERRASVSSSLKSLREPSITPRSTKSSSLRTGSTSGVTSSASRTRPLAILEDQEPTKMATPSSSAAPKRRHSVQVESTRPSAIEVRMSRASMLRNGQTVASSSSATSRSNVSNVNFDGVPGHKRRESIAVPSMHQAPLHSPRPNRASLLRQKSDAIAPPPSARRPSSAVSSTALSVSHARTPSTFTSSTAPRLNRAAELRQKALQASGGKEQVPATPKRGGGTIGGMRVRESKETIVRSADKTPRPKSAMSDLSNGSRV